MFIKLDQFKRIQNIAAHQAGTEAFYYAEGYQDLEEPPNYTDYKYIDGWWVYDPLVQPSPWHEKSSIEENDELQLTWVFNRDYCIEQLSREIDVQRDKNRYLPIEFTYNSIEYYLDGDKQAQDNIKSKLEEVRAREYSNDLAGLLCIWRGYENNNYTFDGILEYHNFLNHYVLRLSDRVSMMYIYGWTLKDNLQTMSDAELISFGLSEGYKNGWPI